MPIHAYNRQHVKAAREKKTLTRASKLDWAVGTLDLELDATPVTKPVAWPNSGIVRSYGAWRGKFTLWTSLRRLSNCASG